MTGVAAKKAEDHDVPRHRQRLAATPTVATVFFFNDRLVEGSFCFLLLRRTL